MKAIEKFFTAALIVLTILSCFSTVFSYAAIAVAAAVVIEALAGSKEYEPMVNFTEALTAA